MTRTNQKRRRVQVPDRAFVRGVKEIEAMHGKSVKMEAQRRIRKEAKIKDISWYYKYRKGMVDYSMSKRFVIESVFESYGIEKEKIFGL